MTLNGVMALILRYFTKFGSFRDALCLKIYVNFQGQECSKTFTFAISSPDEFLHKQLTVNEKTVSEEKT